MEEHEGAQTTLKPKKHNASSSSKRDLRRRDIFLMSFFGFFAAVFVLALISGVAYTIFLGDTSLTGQTLTNLSGEEEVISEEVETAEGIEETVEEITETTESAEVLEEETEEVVEEVVEEAEEVTEEVVEESSTTCTETVTIYLDEAKEINGNSVTLTLLGEHSAQVSVDESKEFLSVGESTTVSGLQFELKDTSVSEETADIYIIC